MTILLFVVGVIAVIGGAEMLVRGASRLAAAAGISPLVIGLTVVAFGTSSPELAVSVSAATAGQSDIAMGNVVGSNVLNVLLILGASALIVPLVVAQQLLRLDVPLMVGASILLLVLALDGSLGTLDGSLLFACLIGYTVFLIVQSRRERDPAVLGEYQQAYGTQPTGGVLRQLALVAAGLALLVIGSNWLVDGAVVFARWLGVSELVIGLTVIAVGTSLPEIAATIIAAIRGERDIAVGNIVGSNIFNILGVLGLSSVIAPGGIAVAPSVLSFDLPVMIAVAVACLPIFFTGWRVDRWEGAVFLGYYVCYTSYLVLRATEHDALPHFSRIMVVFVLPITALTLAIIAYRAWRARVDRAG
ncbi:MAG: calcium/sodium antiporter [Burkholderiales bacterium]